MIFLIGKIPPLVQGAFYKRVDLKIATYFKIQYELLSEIDSRAFLVCMGTDFDVSIAKISEA